MEKFENGKTEIENKPRSGRETTSVTDVNRKRADELIQEDICFIFQNVTGAFKVSNNNYKTLEKSKNLLKPKL